MFLRDFIHSIVCPRCEGEGKVPLSDHLKEALLAVPTKGCTYVENVAAKLDIKPSAASNRLVDLLIMGLLKREREGKYWRYSRA